jgi:hypothetical protein
VEFKLTIEITMATSSRPAFFKNTTLETSLRATVIIAKVTNTMPTVTTVVAREAVSVVVNVDILRLRTVSAASSHFHNKNAIA